MGSMFDLNIVDGGRVPDDMRSRYVAFTERLNSQITGSPAVSFDPLLFPLEVIDHALGQSDGRTTGSVFFLSMMSFVDGDIVIGEVVHHPGQVFIQLEEQIYAQAVIGCVKKGAVFFEGEFFNLRFPGEPSGRSANDGDTALDTLPDVVEGCIGVRKFNGYISRDVVELLSVIDINSASDLMTTRNSDAFDGLAHFAVTYKENFYLYLEIELGENTRNC